MRNITRLLPDMTKSERESFTKERSETLRAQRTSTDVRKNEENHNISKVEEDNGRKDVEEDLMIAPAYTIGGSSTNFINKKLWPLEKASVAFTHQGPDMKRTNRLIHPMEKHHREEECSMTASEQLDGATGAASRLLEIPPIVTHVHSSLPPERWPPIRPSQYLRPRRAKAKTTVMDDSSGTRASTCIHTGASVTDPFKRADRGVDRSIRRYEQRKRRLNEQVEEESSWHHIKKLK